MVTGNSGAGRVLVVDDDPTMRLLAAQALQGDGFEVTLAEDGEQALWEFQREAPDLVLLDVMMPVMDGFTACARIRQLPGGDRTPVVMMTGSDDVESIQRAYDAGATDFITKPVNYLVVTHRVRYMMRAKTTADELRESASLLESSQRVAKIGHWAWDIHSGRVRCSAQLAEIVGQALPSVAEGSHDLVRWVYSAERIDIERAINKAVREGLESSNEHRVSSADASKRIVVHEIQPFFDGSGQVSRILGTVQDITERRNSEKKIRYLAYYDAVTGLANRTLLVDQLNHSLQTAMRRGRYAAVLFFDLDHFKKVNDTLGHSAGDDLLRDVATRLRFCIRDCDFLVHENTLHHDLLERHCVARLGGDEFVVVLSELHDAEDARGVAQRICDAVAMPFEVQGNEVFVTCSVGVSCYPQDGHDVETLLKHADAAMYHAKSRGRNQYQFYTRAIDARVLERVAMENCLRNAIDRGEMEVHYQPKVDTRSGEVSSIEALLRWRSDELGDVPPGTFIPVAEDTGLIVPIGEWALRQACAQGQRWREEGVGDFRMAVNLSAAQFRCASLKSDIESILEESGFPASALELELTESILMDDVDTSARVLESLTRIGISVAVDDFGVGYSSLTHLKRFPVSTLKIDRSFVRDMIGSTDDAAIVSATIALGHSLNLRVVAEGVERGDQLDLLKRYRCDETQGFLFSAPVSGEELGRWLVRAGGPAAGRVLP